MTLLKLKEEDKFLVCLYCNLGDLFHDLIMWHSPDHFFWNLEHEFYPPVSLSSAKLVEVELG